MHYKAAFNVEAYCQQPRFVRGCFRVGMCGFLALSGAGAFTAYAQEAGTAAGSPLVAPVMREIAFQATPDHFYTPSEVMLLQELESRRKELDRREEALDLREKLVDLAENRMGVKIDRMQELEKRLQDMLKNLSEKQEDELLQLAKIYESMKADAAANVMNNMDNKIVFDVFQRMNRKAVAKIMENMAIQKARIISEMLAEKPDLPAFEQN